MDIFDQAAQRIVKKQQHIVGPLAIEQAQKVKGLFITNGRVAVEGNKTETLDKLVSHYEDIFGPASLDVCRDAAGNLFHDLPSDKVPRAFR